MMRGTTLLLLSMLAIPSEAVAQADPPRGHAGGVIGAGRTWDDEGSIGAGVVAGGRVDWRLFGNTGLEGALELLTHDRSGGPFEAEGHTAIFSVSLLHRFGRAAVQPYVLEGLDLAWHSGTTAFGNVRSERTSVDPGFHVGAGVAVRIGTRVEIGPEGRFYFIRPESSSDPAWAYWIGARIGVSF